MNEIEQALLREFEKHRIVLWHDVKHELQVEFTAVSLTGVEKIVLGNNPFGVKYRILREQPEQKFLLYHAGPSPADLNNWLLDVQLAYGQFRADQLALWLHELGLDLDFANVIEPHVEFFRAVRRREQLKTLLVKEDTARQVQMKMLAVCTNAEPRLDAILENLLAELAAEKDEKIRLIERCALQDFLYDQLQRSFDYSSKTPGLRDFAITLFTACYIQGVGEMPAHLAEAHPMTADALVFLKRWKNSVTHREVFKILSGEYADILNIEQDLQQRSYKTLLAQDIFEGIDRKILGGLIHDVSQRTIPADEVRDVLRQRRTSCWFDQYRHVYEALEYASAFVETLDQMNLDIHSFNDGLQGYAQHWYLLDQLYRKFLSSVRASRQVTLMAQLQATVENLYTNSYLLQLNNRWQQMVNLCDRWDARPLIAQQDFYERLVKPFLDRKNKVYVIISDGMRYEIGEELLSLIRQEDRYDAELLPALTMLPSYTQLGMAALLPHKTLSFSTDGTSVLADGHNTGGTENRKAILSHATGGKGTAIQAEDFLAMNLQESRELTRNHHVIYIYHNRIDATGDKRDSEERVFEAAEDTLQELVKLVKKLNNANAYNMLITADHGFIYQHQDLAESDFISQDPQGENILALNRRYVLGKGLMEGSSYKHFTSQQMELEGDLEMLIPNSINRIRVKGAGSRYVHGGAALQEIIIPILQINKKRTSDVSQVNVEILQGPSTNITTGQLSVVFYQAEPVTEKMQARHLRAGLYTEAGLLISDRHDLHCDILSEQPRDRELAVRFILTQQAEDYNNQDVILRLEEPVEGTSHYQTYKTVRYTLRRAFTSDFDF